MSAPRARLHCELLEARLTPTQVIVLKQPDSLQPYFAPSKAISAGDGKVWMVGEVIQPEYRLETTPNEGFNGYGWARMNRLQPAVIRMGTDHLPDPTFNGGKPKTFDIPNADGYGLDILGFATDPQGRLLIASNINPFPAFFNFAYPTIARLNADGTPDATFGNNGVVTINLDIPPVPGSGINFPTPATTLRGMVVTSDGKIVVSANVDGNGSQATILRLTSDGLPDPTFDGDGKQTITVPGQSSSNAPYLTGLVTTPEGKVWVGGSINSQAIVARLTADGELDTTFDGDGVASDPSSLPLLSLTAFSTTPDGGVLLLGYYYTDTTKGSASAVAPRAIELTAGGQLRNAFGSGGRLDSTVDSSLANFYLRDVAVLADGRIRISGTDAANSGFASVFGFLPDGSPDPDFKTFQLRQRTTQYVSLGELAALPDGQLLLSAYTTQSTVYLIGPDGTPESSLVVPLTALPDPIPLPPSPPGVSRTPTVPAQPVLVGGPNGTATPYYPDSKDSQLKPDQTVTLFPGSTAGVRTTSADVTGDGIPDLIGVTAPGVPTRVAVTDGATGAVIASFAPFEAGFTGGAFVAGGDVDGDGFADVVVTPDAGGGPVVVVFRGTALVAGLTGDAAQLVRFLGIDDSHFRGGARVAVGDVNGDGRVDVVVAAGTGGGPRVAVFDGRALATGSLTHVMPDFFAFEKGLRNGVYVSAGDIDGDGFADLVFGGGPGGGPRVLVANGQSALGTADLTASLASAAPPRGLVLANLFAGNPSDRGGVRVAARVIAGFQGASLITGTGSGASPEARVYSATTLATGANPDQVFDPTGLDPAAGVFVG